MDNTATPPDGQSSTTPTSTAVAAIAIRGLYLTFAIPYYLTFDLRGGARGAKRPLGCPLDGIRRDFPQPSHGVDAPRSLVSSHRSTAWKGKSWNRLHEGRSFAYVRDLVERAQAKPGTFNYGSAGIGSVTHMNAEVFGHAAGIQAQHVPFKGTPEAVNEAMAGRIDWFFATMVSDLPLIHSGKVKALVVGTAKRSEALPQLPTTAESGVPAGNTCSGWDCSHLPRRLGRSSSACMASAGASARPPT